MAAFLFDNLSRWRHTHTHTCHRYWSPSGKSLDAFITLVERSQWNATCGILPPIHHHTICLALAYGTRWFSSSSPLSLPLFEELPTMSLRPPTSPGRLSLSVCVFAIKEQRLVCRRLVFVSSVSRPFIQLLSCARVSMQNKKKVHSHWTSHTCLSFSQKFLRPSSCCFVTIF